MANKVAKFGVLVALAMIFSYIEAIIPVAIGIPGVKLGLANLVVVVALFTINEKSAFYISLLRIVLVGFTFGSFYSLLYSLAGGIMSLGIMVLAKRWNGFGIIGVSVLGGVTHNIGQIIVAVLVVETVSIFFYLPILLIVGVITGVIIGLLGEVTIKRILKVEQF